MSTAELYRAAVEARRERLASWKGRLEPVRSLVIELLILTHPNGGWEWASQSLRFWFVGDGYFYCVRWDSGYRLGLPGYGFVGVVSQDFPDFESLRLKIIELAAEATPLEE